MTPPPGWSPPPYNPEDILIDGVFGQSLSAGGMTVSATSHGIYQGTPSSGCPYHDGGSEIREFQFSVTWSGFVLGWPGVGPYAWDYSACTIGPSPLTSGAVNQVLIWREPGQTRFELGFFPNNASPAYIFRFH